MRFQLKSEIREEVVQQSGPINAEAFREYSENMNFLAEFSLRENEAEILVPYHSQTLLVLTYIDFILTILQEVSFKLAAC